MAFTLFPAIDIRDGNTVQLVKGCVEDEIVYADPVSTAKNFVAGGAEWLHVVDLDAAFTGQPRNRHLIGDIIAATDVRVQASGGIRTVYDLNAVANQGAEKIVISTKALGEPDFVEKALEHFNENTAVGLDADGRTLRAHGWTEESGDLFETLQKLTDLGVPRFVFNDVTRDGTLTGPNIDQLVTVADSTTAQITASGGIGSIDDLIAVATCHPRVDAAIVGKALYDGVFSLSEAFEVVTNRGNHDV